MAEVDTSIYRLQQPKSYFDYLQEMAAADDAKSSRERNKLAMMLLQGQVQDATQARDQRNRLAQALQGLGANATDEQRISTLRANGGFDQADSLEKSILERKKTGAQVEKDTAEAEKIKLATLHSKVDRHTQLLASIQSPQELAQWVMQGVQEGVMDQAKAQQLLSQPPRTPQEFEALKAKMQAGGLSLKDQIEQKWKEADFGLKQQAQAETGRHNRASEGLIARGQNMTDARARDLNDITKQGQRTQVVETPDGVMLVDRGTGLARPAATMDGKPLQGKQPEAVRKQAAGIDALSGAIDDYLGALSKWGATDALRPDERAKMGTFYNNMMLQAKEAYNLGVLNGPDYQILTSVVTDPVSLKGAVTSNEALGKQAETLKRLMGKVKGAVTGKPPAKPGKSVARTGKDASGRRVVQYDDGSIEYAD